MTGNQHWIHCGEEELGSLEEQDIDGSTMQAKSESTPIWLTSTPAYSTPPSSPRRSNDYSKHEVAALVSSPDYSASYNSGGGSTVNGKNKNNKDMDLVDLRIQRKKRTVVFGVVGGVVGLIVLGPLGAVAGGLAGALGTKANGKRKERRRLQQLAEENKQEQQRYQDEQPPEVISFPRIEKVDTDN